MTNSVTSLPFPWPLGVLLAALAAVPIVQAVRDVRSETLLQQAKTLQASLELDPALKALQDAVQINPRDAGAQLKLAQASRTLWFYRRTPALKAQADAAFGQAQALSPSWPSPHYEHSLMYAFVEDYPRALTILQGAIDRDPNNAAYWYQKGTYQEFSKDVKAARTSYERCLVLNGTLRDCREALSALPAGDTP